MPSSRVRTAVLTVAVAVAMAGCSSGTVDDPAGGQRGSLPAATSPTPDRAGDIAFAQAMIPHHVQAIAMADLALRRTDASAAVKALATDIGSVRDPQIRTMEGWLASWGAPTTSDGPASHDLQGMLTEPEVRRLRAATGHDFDRMWLTMMIEHDEGAVTIAQQVLASTRTAEVRTLASAIVSVQQTESAQLRTALR
jgi:uncharacterized protein (DUF305 family)